MDATATPPTFTESYARQQLAKLAACKEIRGRQTDDALICENDDIPVEGGRHSREHIRQLRDLAGPAWPR